MKAPILFGLFVWFCILSPGNSNVNRKRRVRIRRYIAFPEGSLFSTIFCLTNLMKLPAGSDLLSLNINWGIGYELPNDTRPFLEEYKPAMKRRHRRDLYGRVEKVLNSMGYDGRSCLLRSVCEAEQRFTNLDDNLVYKILSLVFRFPQEPLLKTEPDIHRTYHYASQMGRSVNDNLLKAPKICFEAFHCPFSLIDIALGYHSVSALQSH